MALWIQMANFNIKNMIINQWTVGGACLNCQTTFEPTILLETWKPTLSWKTQSFLLARTFLEIFIKLSQKLKPKKLWVHHWVKNWSPKNPSFLQLFAAFGGGVWSPKAWLLVHSPSSRSASAPWGNDQWGKIWVNQSKNEFFFGGDYDGF